MSRTINQRMTLADWTILLVLSGFWGGSFLFIEILLRELPPFTMVLGRVGFAGILMYAFLRATSRRLPGGAAVWRSFFVLAALNNAIPFVLFAYGQTYITSGLASILNATTPLWGVIVTHVLTADEKATGGKIAGVVLGIAGVVVMIGSDALSGLGSNVLAQLACLAATLCYALASVYGRRFKKQGIGAWEVSTGQLLAATVLILPFSFVLEQPWTLPALSTATILAMAGFVLFSTVIAYFLYFKLLENAGAMNSLLVTFLIPIPAILLGTVFLGESLEPKHYAGMALIALGLAAIDGRPLGWLLSRGRASKAGQPG